MKKYYSLLGCVGLLLVGCTSKEQNEQIKNFWTEQVMNAAVKSGKMPNGLARLPRNPSETGELTPEMVAELTKDMSPEQKKAFEEMMQQMQQFPSQIEPNQPLPSNTKVVDVILFYHPDAPAYQQLLQDRWDTLLRQQYRNRINLKEYNVSDESNRDFLRQTMRQHHLKRLSVPTIIIGDAVIGPYPFHGVDQAIEKAATAPDLVAQPKTVKKSQPNQFMQITMEDDDQSIANKASPKENRAIQAALSKVRQENQSTLQDIEQFFDKNTYAEAFSLISKNEEELAHIAGVSPSYTVYLANQKRILTEQEARISLLLKQNANKVKRKVR